MSWRQGTKVKLNVYAEDGRPICQAHTEEDARLIAAAEDLRDELREARSMLRACGLEEPDDDYQRAWDAALARIDAAIAKATGEGGAA